MDVLSCGGGGGWLKNSGTPPLFQRFESCVPLPQDIVPCFLHSLG